MGITKNNAISFVLRYVVEGVERRRYTIGGFPALSSTAAREMALKLKGDVIKGIDPLEKKAQALKAIGFEEFVGKYMSYAKTHIKESTNKIYKFFSKTIFCQPFAE